MVSTNSHNGGYEYSDRDKKGEVAIVSDSFLLCPKCGEELLTYGRFLSVILYYCSHCHEGYVDQNAKVSKTITTEYLKGEKDEQSNQSRRSKE